MRAYAFFLATLTAAFGYWAYQAEVRLQTAEMLIASLASRTQQFEVRIEAIDLKADRTLEVARVSELTVKQTLQDAEEAIEANKRLMKELRDLQGRLRKPVRKTSVEEDEELDLDEEEPYRAQVHF